MRWPWQRRVDPQLGDRLAALVGELEVQNEQACKVVESIRTQIGQITRGQDR